MAGMALYSDSTAVTKSRRALGLADLGSNNCVLFGHGLFMCVCVCSSVSVSSTVSANSGCIDVGFVKVI